MTFGKDPLIPDEGEDFENFMNNFGYFWDSGYSADKISKEMCFGKYAIEEAKRQGKEPGQVGYPHIKPHHVYYIAKKYRDEYGLEPRRKHKKPEEPETKTFYGVPREADMPHEVVQYLMRKGWLLE